MAYLQNPEGSDHENELSGLLSVEERTELTLLIANIAEVMGKKITAVFDVSAVDENRPRPLPLSKGSDTNEVGGKEEADEAINARKLREKREAELSVPEILELKSSSLGFFEKWRESLLARVGTAVNNSKEVADKQKEKAIITSHEITAVQHQTKVIKPNTNVEEADAALIAMCPPTSTSLVALPRDKRVLILNAMLLLVLSLEHYLAHSRVLLQHIASSLHLPLHILAEDEVKVAQGLLEAAKDMSGAEEARKRGDENKTARRWKVGLAGVAGAAVIGVTGGLAAPLVAGAIGIIMGGLGLGATTAAGLLGALAESGIIVGSLFGAYGGRMTGKMMDAYAKEVDDFAFLPLKGSKNHETLPKDRRLRVTIGISGWLTQKEDIITPWRALGRQSEVFALRWELEALTKLGSSIESMVKSAAWGVAKKQIIARTIFASLMEALWPIALLKVSKIVDNPFSVAKSRADKAGEVLADALINKAQGERPVTLVGYSLGARLIYSCLMSLAERRAFGLIESVVLIGAPTPSDASVWRAIRSVVAGRLVNVYSENDYILAFLYRTSSIQYGVAGLQEVQGITGVENVNVSELISGHLRYQYSVGSILQKIGFEDIDVDQVAKEEETLALLEEEDKEEEAGKKKEYIDPDKEAVQMEKDVEKKTQQKMMQKAGKMLHLS